LIAYELVWSADFPTTRKAAFASVFVSLASDLFFHFLLSRPFPFLPTLLKGATHHCLDIWTRAVVEKFGILIRSEESSFEHC